MASQLTQHYEVLIGPGPYYLRPISDITPGDWVATPGSPSTLYDKIDESVYSDADYISGTNTVELKYG